MQSVVFLIFYLYLYVYIFIFLSAMTPAIFRYVIRHIFMADFWLSAMNHHSPLTTLVETHGKVHIEVFKLVF